jgi:hypothetical protein
VADGAVAEEVNAWRARDFSRYADLMISPNRGNFPRIRVQVPPRTLRDHRLTCGYAIGQDFTRVACGLFPQVRTMGVQVGSRLRNGNNHRLPDPDLRDFCGACTHRKPWPPKDAARMRRGWMPAFETRTCRAPPTAGSPPAPADPSRRPSPVVTAGLPPFPRRRAYRCSYVCQGILLGHLGNRWVQGFAERRTRQGWAAPGGRAGSYQVTRSAGWRVPGAAGRSIEGQQGCGSRLAGQAAQGLRGDGSSAPGRRRDLRAHPRGRHHRDPPPPH